MSFSAEDNALHFGGGALLLLPLALIPHPATSFFVFTLWGLLREQAQKNERGAGFRNNWIHIWNGTKLVEGLFWGLGALAVHLPIWIFLD